MDNNMYQLVRGFKIKLNDFEFKIKPGTTLVSNSKNLLITETYEDGFCDIFDLKGLVSFKKHVTDIISHGKKCELIGDYIDLTYFPDVFNSIKHLPSSYGGISVNAIHTPEVIGRVAKIKYGSSEYIREYIGRIDSVYSLKKIIYEECPDGSKLANIEYTNYVLLNNNIPIEEKYIKDLEIY